MASSWPKFTFTFIVSDDTKNSSLQFASDLPTYFSSAFSLKFDDVVIPNLTPNDSVTAVDGLSQVMHSSNIEILHNISPDRNFVKRGTFGCRSVHNCFYFRDCLFNIDTRSYGLYM